MPKAAAIASSFPSLTTAKACPLLTPGNAMLEMAFGTGFKYVIGSNGSRGEGLMLVQARILCRERRFGWRVSKEIYLHAEQLPR